MWSSKADREEAFFRWLLSAISVKADQRFLMSFMLTKGNCIQYTVTYDQFDEHRMVGEAMERTASE